MKRSSSRRNRNQAEIGAAALWILLYAGLILGILSFFTLGNTLYFPKHVPQADFPYHGGGSAAVCQLLSTAKFRVALGQYYADQGLDVTQYRVKVKCTIGDASQSIAAIDQWRGGLEGYTSSWTMPMTLAAFDVHHHLVVFPKGYAENLLMDVFVFNDGEFFYTVVSNSTY